MNMCPPPIIDLPRPLESSVTALEQMGEVCPTATVSAPEAHATTESTLTAPSFIEISGSPSLTQSSATSQGNRTHAKTASELHVVPPPFREPRGNQNSPRLHAYHGMQGLVVVLTNFVDFATNVTGQDVMAHIAASSARNSFVDEGVVRETSKAVGDTQITISRDGENSTNIFLIYLWKIHLNFLTFPRLRRLM